MHLEHKRARWFCAASATFRSSILGRNRPEHVVKNGGKYLPEAVHSNIVGDSMFSMGLHQQAEVIQGLFGCWMIATVLIHVNGRQDDERPEMTSLCGFMGIPLTPPPSDNFAAVFSARSSEPVQGTVPASSLSGHRLLCPWVWHLKISGIPVKSIISSG